MEQEKDTSIIYAQGAVIFREGSRSMCMYAVRSGNVVIYANYGEKEEKILTTLEPGKFFGEMGLVRGYPRSATAVASAPDTRVDAITWDGLGEYYRTNPNVIVAIMQQMANRLADLTADYIGACGEIAHLVEECNRLKQEAAQNSGVQPAAEQKLEKPVWEKRAGESQREEDKRFKKYLEDYRRYLKDVEKMSQKTGKP